MSCYLAEEAIKVDLVNKRLKTTLLDNSDFKSGTYRIQKPGKYVLKEDIIFHPHPENDFRPIPGDGFHSTFAYLLGFFTGIAIESDDVILDLNGHDFSRSFEFSIKSAFFANITLGNAPFIMKQGPVAGGFQTEFKAPKRVWIHNGTMKGPGRPHHGIHGNGPENVVISEMDIQGFEVAAVAINGGNNIFHANFNYGPSSEISYINGLWSSFVHAVFRAEDALEKKPDAALQAAVNVARGVLVASWKVLMEIQTTGNLELLNQIHPAFQNDRFDVGGKIIFPEEGVIYGILHGPIGVAVNDLMTSTEKGTTSRIHIRDGRLRDLTSNLVEIPAAVGPDNKPEIGVTGELLRWKDLTSPHAQLVIAISEYEKKTGVKVGTTRISEDVRQAAKAGQQYQPPKVMCSGDTQFHVAKGMFGIRLDAAEYVAIQCVEIENLWNNGPRGEEVLDGAYIQSHPKQNPGGYKGADAVGINLSCCRGIHVKDVKIRNVQSDRGNASGVRVLYNSKEVKLKDVTVERVLAAMDSSAHYSTKLPNKCPKAFGVFIDELSEAKLKKVHVDEISGPVAIKVADNSYC